MNQQNSASSGANGHSTAQDIFLLSDEQILEISPEPQDIEVLPASPGAAQPANVAPVGPEPQRAPSPAGSAEGATKAAHHQGSHDASQTSSQQSPTEHGSRNTQRHRPGSPRK